MLLQNPEQGMSARSMSPKTFRVYAGILKYMQIHPDFCIFTGEGETFYLTMNLRRYLMREINVASTGAVNYHVRKLVRLGLLSLSIDQMLPLHVKKYVVHRMSVGEFQVLRDLRDHPPGALFPDEEADSSNAELPEFHSLQRDFLEGLCRYLNEKGSEEERTFAAIVATALNDLGRAETSRENTDGQEN